MKPAIALVALIVSACAGSADRVTDPITQTPVGFDSCAVARPDLSGPATQADLALFAYDANAQLNLQKVVENTSGGVEFSAISYDSPAGGRVTGILVNPVTRSSLRPGIILMHGSPGSSRDTWLTNDARTLANYGAVVIAIDAPFARRTGPSLRMTTQDREEQIQLMKDLQRAVDVLRALPNVDKNRIAYVGVSYGGAMGVQFAAIDHRIKAAALVVGDGGWVTHYTQTGGLTFLATLSCATRAAWFREMIPIEPIRFFGFAKPTPLLLQNGRLDESVSEADAKLLHSAAPEPKTALWYNTGHNLNQQAVLDRHDWLVQQIGLDPR
jgi:dipeptidyl aminopeptidase/acylaminoacyl peptidase